MTSDGTSRKRKIALALTTALVAALGLYWRAVTDTPPAAPPPLAAPLPGRAASEQEPERPRVRPSSLASPRNVQEQHTAPPAPLPPDAAPQARPTLPVFDLATLAHPAEPRESKEEERFRTNQWFSEQDLQHPELYFNLAERMRELERPEERRDALDFFLAYRGKLQRDLEAVGKDRNERLQILATIARYDTAIARLRELVAEEAAR